MIRKPLKTIVTEINHTLISRIEKTYKTSKIIVSHFSVISEFEKMQKEVDSIVVSDKKDACIAILKEVCNSENKTQCRALLAELSKSFSDFENYPAQFEDRIFKYKDYWLPYKF